VATVEGYYGIRSEKSSEVERRGEERTEENRRGEGRREEGKGNEERGKDELPKPWSTRSQEK